MDGGGDPTPAGVLGAHGLTPRLFRLCGTRHNRPVLVRIGTAIALLVPVGAAAGTANAPSAATPPVRIAFLVDPAGGPDYPLQRLQIQGVRRAVDQLGVEAEVVTPSPREGGTAALARFGRQGYDLVMGFDYDTSLSVADVARRYPKTVFAALEYSRADFERPPPNLIGLPFRAQGIGYVVGYLAGLMERRRRGRDAVGAVGGFRLPPVLRFIAGFGAGARRAAPGITVLTGYAESFVDPDKCRRVALGQLAKGAGTVFDVAGDCGRGTLAAARVRGRWAIGVDFDRSSLGPHVLSSAVKRYDVAVFELVRTLVRGDLRRGRDYPQTLANGAFSLGTFSPEVPQPIRERVRAVLREVAAGRVRGIPESPTP